MSSYERYEDRTLDYILNGILFSSFDYEHCPYFTGLDVQILEERIRLAVAKISFTALIDRDEFLKIGYDTGGHYKGCIVKLEFFTGETIEVRASTYGRALAYVILDIYDTIRENTDEVLQYGSEGRRFGK